MTGAIIDFLLRAGSGKVLSFINRTKISLPARYLALTLGRKSTHKSMIPQAPPHRVWAQHLIFIPCQSPTPRNIRVSLGLEHFHMAWADTTEKSSPPYPRAQSGKCAENNDLKNKLHNI